MRLRVLGVFSLASLVLATSSALGDPVEAPLSLAYRAPPGCPDREQVIAEVTRLARLDQRSQRRVEATITVSSGAPDAFTLELVSSFEGTPGERTLDGQSCASVVNAATLILALMLNPEAQREGGDPALKPTPSSAAPPPPPAPPLEPRATNEPTQAPTPRLPLSFELGGLAGARLGALPEAAFEPGALALFGWGPFGAGVDATYLPSQRRGAAGDQSAGGRLWVLSGAAFLSYWAPLGSARVGPEVGIELTRLQGRGAKISDPRVGRIYWTSLRMGLDAGLGLSSQVVLQARVQALVPLAHPAVFVDELVIHRPDRWGGRAGLGLFYVWQ